MKGKELQEEYIKAIAILKDFLDDMVRDGLKEYPDMIDETLKSIHKQILEEESEFPDEVTQELLFNDKTKGN